MYEYKVEWTHANKKSATETMNTMAQEGWRVVATSYEPCGAWLIITFERKVSNLKQTEE